MSIKIMSWVWENGPEDPVERLVLLALADFSNDAGECWPSMIGIGAKAGLTDRGARKVVRRLEAAGWLQTSVGGGRGGKSVYRILTARNPEQETRNDIPGIENPERGDAKPGTSVHKTRNSGSAEPSVTINKPKTRATRFDEFWNAYPHRGGVKRDRKTSLQRYEKAMKAGVTEQTLIDAAKALHRDRRVIEGYAKDPATWLNKEGWTEGIEAVPSQAHDDPLKRWKRIASQ